ncbi:WASH complex subunit 3 [Phytophthora citrophthora]|uniref:WASH complex subunit 3 n=1 Tax=Phytophthora citrophthora TaxID=4793 RepID=A0AAD9GTK9_9STRA|nr:WASH complex subunit 3 [Phytophthora citrophthora]
MADSDSDDELMSRLTSMGMGIAAASGEDCDYCATPNASLACTICNQAVYCSETCKRRHARAHRNFCIKTRMEKEAAEQEEEEDSEEEEDESDSESEDVAHAPLSAGRGGSGIAIPGLTPIQIKKLLDLASKSDAASTSSSIDKLQKQISQLMADKKSGAAGERRSSGASLKEIKALQEKLSELEKKTQNVAYAPQSGNMMARTSIYTALRVKDDPAMAKYFKLKSMDMPIEQIKIKMKADGVSADLLDTPDAISPNDPGPEKGAYVPMTVAEDPAFKKYFKLKGIDMPIDQIKTKMKTEGVDPDLLDNPNSVSPNDPGPQVMSGYPSNGMASPLQGSSGGFSWTSMPTAAPVVPYDPLYVKDDPKFQKYFKLRQMGMLDEQIKLKMKAEEVDPDLLDRPDDVSPNDPGPPVQAPASPTGPVSMEQLFSILMQHQQIIQQVSNGGSISGARGRGSSGGGGAAGMPPRSVEDQMAQELAAAESAIDDIFGDESQQSKGPGGMNMIEQLEKKARKDSNKKLVENRDEVNRLVAELLTTALPTDEEAISFYKTIAPKLEEFGLALGTDSVQTWSSRLLIKNKDTRDWYFSEQERLDAGKAYGRLWGLSFLERDAGQLIAKRAQILNAPATMRAIAKGKPELIDKFTQLLKDTVKLKHKVFKSGSYAAEVRQLHTFNIPERFEERGTELIDSAVVLADASMDLAEEEFRALENATRAKKIRALAVVHAAEKAVTLVGIVKKIGTQGVNEVRLREVEATLAKIKDMYLSGEKEEEEEDDVL